VEGDTAQKIDIVVAHGDGAENEPTKPARLGSEILTDLGNVTDRKLSPRMRIAPWWPRVRLTAHPTR